MPRRIDHLLVLAEFERLKNGRDVARVLNIHENTVYQITRKARGQCVRCLAPVSPGKTSCKACLEWDKTRVQAARKKRVRHGLCAQCGQPRSRLSKMYCEEHRITAAERNEKWRETRKNPNGRGAGKPGIVNTRQKHRMLRSQYGENGIKCWEDAGGACKVCNRTNQEVSVHIHHIDEDYRNNDIGNLACLCFYCHGAIHALLDVKDRCGLVRWFEATYPDKPLREVGSI